MTLNEKAATFIGWTPDQPCLNKKGYEVCSGFVPSSRYHNARCLDCGWESLARKGEVVLNPHTRISPDMTDSINLMQAIDRVLDKGLTISISPRHIIIHDVHGLNVAEAANQGDTGLAMQNALAKLYDVLALEKESA